MDADVVVIGAGAVGLAVATAFARCGQDTLVLERAGGIGTGASSRNSEVIHAGLYYPTGSLRHRLCVEGRRRLYQYLSARGVPHRKTGKLIVASSEPETAQIEAIYRRGLENGVEKLALLGRAEATAMEPQLSCTAAIWSPETGIVDSHGYLVALQAELEDQGGSVVLHTAVERIEPIRGGGFRLWADGEPAISCRRLVNSAGLSAHRVARQVEGLAAEHIPKLVLAKGSYFGCAGRPAFRRLIYPAPVEGGLGVHLTLDLAGRMRFGPDVEWLAAADPDQVDYAVDPRRCSSFYPAIRRYWPGLPEGALTPDYAGCRGKLSARGEPAADFRIDGPERHGIEGLVNLFGIESPGLTSSPAIAEEVRRRLAGAGS
jgi:L-2-hydroxyglutarate oxidase LhgO